MNDSCGVEELESSKNLIDEILDVFCEQLLPRPDNSAQIGLHQLTDQVYVSKHLSETVKLSNH